MMGRKATSQQHVRLPKRIPALWILISTLILFFASVRPSDNILTNIYFRFRNCRLFLLCNIVQCGIIMRVTVFEAV